MNKRLGILSASKSTGACLIGALALSGCYIGGAVDASPEVLRRGQGWVATPAVKLLRQVSRTDCGAAALAMVLSFWSVPTRVVDVSAAYPRSPGRGLTAAQLRQFALARGLSAYVFRGRLQDIWRELSQGRPVVVGLVKTYLPRTLSHYEVVIGLNREKRKLVTLDPAHGLRENSFRGFLKEWEAAKRLTLMVFWSSAGAVPARPAKAVWTPRPGGAL